MEIESLYLSFWLCIKKIKIPSTFKKSNKNIKSLHLILCEKLFRKILWSILNYYDIFEKSILYLHWKCTLEANIWHNMTSYLYYWHYEGKISNIHFIDFKFINFLVADKSSYWHTRNNWFLNTCFFYDSVLLWFC